MKKWRIAYWVVILAALISALVCFGYWRHRAVFFTFWSISLGLLVSTFPIAWQIKKVAGSEVD